MNRRDLITAAAATFGHGLVGRSLPAAAGPELDRYGGWKGKKFQATGWFRTEKDDRWWLVTPDGNAFLSFGINHFHPNFWNADYNRETWQKRLGVKSMNLPDSRNALRSWFLQTCREYGFNSIGVHNLLSVLNAPSAVMPYLQPIRFVDIPALEDRDSRSELHRCLCG